MRLQVLFFVVLLPFLVHVAIGDSPILDIGSVDSAISDLDLDSFNSTISDLDPIVLNESSIEPVGLPSNPTTQSPTTLTSTIGSSSTTTGPEDCSTANKEAISIVCYVFAAVAVLLTILFIAAIVIVRVAVCTMAKEGMAEPKKPWETVMTEGGEQTEATMTAATQDKSGYTSVSQHA